MRLTVFILNHYNCEAWHDVCLRVSGGDIDEEVLSRFIAVVVQDCGVETDTFHAWTKGEGGWVGYVVLTVCKKGTNIGLVIMYL